MHRFRPIALPLSSLAAALTLAACNGTTPADNMSADTNTVMINDSVMTDNLVTPAEAPPPIAAPVVAPSVPQAEAAPVAEAAQTAQAIDSDRRVTRIAQNDGWAWMRDGQVIRTASRDGRRVAYYRNGERDPYFVQQDGEGYSYDGGHVNRAFGRDGRPQQIDDTRRRQAEDLDQQARAQHDHARDATDRRPRPMPTPTPDGRSHDDYGARGGHDHGPAPTPTPTPTPTDDHHHGDRGHDGQRGGMGDQRHP